MKRLAILLLSLILNVGLLFADEAADIRARIAAMRTRSQQIWIEVRRASTMVPQLSNAELGRIADILRERNIIDRQIYDLEFELMWIQFFGE